MNNFMFKSAVSLIIACAGVAYGGELGGTFRLNAAFLSVYPVATIEHNVSAFDNNVTRVRGYIYRAKGEVYRLFPSKASLRAYQVADSLDLLAADAAVDAELAGAKNASCVELAGLFDAYTHNFFGLGNFESQYGRIEVGKVSPCSFPATSKSAPKSINLANIEVPLRSDFSQAYLNDAGEVVFATDGACRLDDICHVYVVRGASIAIHIGRPLEAAAPAPSTATTEATLAAEKAMPGAGDANLLRLYRRVLFVSRSGERFLIQGESDRAHALYLGGGNARLGEYIQKVWEPDRSGSWYFKKAMQFSTSPR